MNKNRVKIAPLDTIISEQKNSIKIKKATMVFENRVDELKNEKDLFSFVGVEEIEIIMLLEPLFAWLTHKTSYHTITHSIAEFAAVIKL